MTWGIDTDEPRTAAEVIERARAIKARFERIDRIAKHNNVRIEREKREAQEALLSQMRAIADEERKSREKAQHEAVIRMMEEDFQRFIDARAAEESIVSAAPSRNMIVLACAQVAGVTRNDIAGPWRNVKVVAARQMVFWVLRNSTQLSLTQIGSYTQRDHTTILHGIRKVDSLLGDRAAEIKAMHYTGQIEAVWALTNPKKRIRGGANEKP